MRRISTIKPSNLLIRLPYWVYMVALFPAFFYLFSFLSKSRDNEIRCPSPFTLKTKIFENRIYLYEQAGQLTLAQNRMVVSFDVRLRVSKGGIYLLTCQCVNIIS